MQIEVRARIFFEVRKGEKREKELMRTHRVISINNISFPAEPPPFSEQYLTADNLLVLYFDDIDEGPNAMTEEQAKQIVDFVCNDDPRPIIVHCTAGISRSGAVGEVLNWYFNRYLEDDRATYRLFYVLNRGLIPNSHVRRLLLTELQRRHDTLKSMVRSIHMRRQRQYLLHGIISLWLEKHLYPDWGKWFAPLECLRFSEKAVRGDPEIFHYAKARFLRSGCGITEFNDNVLVVNLNGDSEMRRIFAMMLEMAEPECYEFKGNDAEHFFEPFMPAIGTRIFQRGRPLLDSLQNAPQDAVVELLVQDRWQYLGMWGKMGVDHNAKRFDECYAEFERKKK